MTVDVEPVIKDWAAFYATVHAVFHVYDYRKLIPLNEAGFRREVIKLGEEIIEKRYCPRCGVPVRKSKEPGVG